MIGAHLRERDRDAVELMDAPDCDPEALARTYARFRLVNAVVAGWWATYRLHVRPLLPRERPATVLDVGCGGGDLARALARWARRDGIALEVTGVDPDPRAHAWAVSRPPVDGVRFERALSADLVAQGRRFDVVVSNHLLHHLDDEELRALLDDSRTLARRRALHSDIARSRWAYLLFSAGALPLAPGSFIRADGLTSIRRSWRPAELRAHVPPGWRVERPWPGRNLLAHDPPVHHTPHDGAGP
ncbi:class I SAM-dependent methyltransferase [Paenibacillus sp. TRM 82003]|uniref:class I SAM-dependent methyltransferase n=1 Tax=Kineococcus sp. TRM81007 TaxID=2925831 RepID=UPI001F5AD2CA|nr:class I SAM-dependent methyltransferase [Kineococcus sp. TRM81007]MCI2238588.1 class I SAM-dependent methyltransferase [Kineococcus sp. TRM81007]MCI3921559.1 class I SAM-dependent methyltransferase [Paenibacillus sp. TRM 82003]